MSNATSNHPYLPPDQYNPVSKPKPKPDRTWNGFTAIVVVIVIFLVSIYGGALLLGLYAGSQGWSDARIDNWLDSVEAQFLYILFDELISVGLLFAFLRLRKYKNVRKTLGLLKPKLKDLGYMAVGMVAYFGLFIAVATLLSHFVSINLDQEQDVGFQAAGGQGDLALVFISLVVLPPLVEELLFRGFLFGSLRKRLKFAVATLVTSALFAVPHLLGGMSGEGLLWIAGVDTFTLSVVLCYLREKTGRLWAGMGVHALKNAVAFWALFIYK